MLGMVIASRVSLDCVPVPEFQLPRPTLRDRAARRDNAAEVVGREPRFYGRRIVQTTSPNRCAHSRCRHRRAVNTARDLQMCRREMRVVAAGKISGSPRGARSYRPQGRPTGCTRAVFFSPGRTIRDEPTHAGHRTMFPWRPVCKVRKTWEADMNRQSGRAVRDSVASVFMANKFGIP